MTSLPVLIVGSMAFDDLELPSGKFTDVVGGSATYGSLAASLHGQVRLVAVVGEDFPQPFLESLKKRSVDVSGVERKAGKTFRWAGRYSENLASRETLDTQLNVFASFEPKLPSEYRDTPLVMLGNIHPALQISVLDQLDRPKLVIADTMNFWMDRELPTLEKLLKRVDLLVINEEEVRQLTGEHHISRAGRAALTKGPKAVLIKRGEYGAILFDEAGAFFVPGYPLEDVVDPTGAGDTFAGALLGSLASSGGMSPMALRQAMVTASTTASFCVEGVGTEALQRLDADRLGLRTQLFRKLTQIEV